MNRGAGKKGGVRKAMEANYHEPQHVQRTHQNTGNSACLQCAVCL